MDVLVCLAEKPGEVVPKQQLMGAVWPETFVTDDVLTRCISELRKAFQDDPNEPQFIQTIPRRGYRLVAAVEPALRVQFAGSTSPYLPQANGGVFRRHSWVFLIGAAIVIGGGITVGSHFTSHSKPRLPSKDPLVIAEFTNTTGDHVFDGTLRRGLAAHLEQSPYFNIVSDEQIAGTLRLMSQPSATPLTLALARQVCLRKGGMVVLDGSIAQIGNQYQLILNASECSTGSQVASVEVIASDKNQILGALGRAASSIRDQLGESLASIQKFNTPLDEVTTSSLEALQMYTLGSQAHANGDESSAASLLERAVTLDPKFAAAYSTLGEIYFNLNESSLAARSARKAYEVRDHVSELEKFYISSDYQLLVTGNLEKAAQTLELLARTYDRDSGAVGNLAVDNLLLGRPQRALTLAHRALELDPNSAVNYLNLAVSYICLGRFDDAAHVLKQADARGIDSPYLHTAAYQLAFFEGNTGEMAREAEWSAGKPGIEDLTAAYDADTAVYAGQFIRANNLTTRAIASAQRAGEMETAATYLAEAALREALVGNAPQAQKQATTALEASKGRHTEAVAAIALALTGKLSHSQKLADDLAERFPEDTIVQFHYLPTIRAAIALGQKSPAKAIAELQAASPYELGTPALLIFLNLYPVYVRGQAYLAAHQGVDAAGEFQKILDHPGIAFNEVIVPLAQLNLGRARAIAGDKAGARKAYEDFFSFWRHADPYLPVVQQAKAEFARLQ